MNYVINIKRKLIRRINRWRLMIILAVFVVATFLVVVGIRDIEYMVMNAAPSCDEYIRSAAIKHLVYYDVTKTKHNLVTFNDVTMVTQMTEDRLARLHLMMKYWEGPISVAIYINKKTIGRFLHRIRARRNVVVHLAVAEGTFYPINFLRNLALNGTSTRFVFVNDIDFIPCRESYKRLLKYTKKLKKNQLLVIPAFEELSNGTRLADQFPENKNALMKLWNEEAVVPFHFTDFMPGHNATNYKKWSRAKNPYQIKWTKWYEPYVVGYTAELPKYNQQYVGRYENKAEHVAEMYARGFELLVLPDVCIVHVWHPRAARDSNMYRCSWKVSLAYLQYLEKKYNVLLL